MYGCMYVCICYVCVCIVLYSMFMYCIVLHVLYVLYYAMCVGVNVVCVCVCIYIRKCVYICVSYKCMLDLCGYLCSIHVTTK